jgi:hypothetical protein
MRDHIKNMKVFISAAYSGPEKPARGAGRRSVLAIK